MNMEDIVIKGNRHSMIFSNGILVSSLLRAGMGLDKSYQIANSIHEVLLSQKLKEIDEFSLSNYIEDTLESQGEFKVLDNYRVWQRVRNEPCGICILIGGVTGIGKSTVAKEVSYRLGITNALGSDSIRQVMRKVLSPTLLPEIHKSTFQAHDNIDLHPILSKTIIGFERQCRLVSVGLEGIVERNQEEGTNVLIDGIHVVPGFFKQQSNTFPFVLHLNNLEEHQRRIHDRSFENQRRPKRYLDNMNEIISIQRYIRSQAQAYNVPIIENNDMEASVNIIIQTIIDALKSRFEHEEKNTYIKDTQQVS